MCLLSISWNLADKATSWSDGIVIYNCSNKFYVDETLQAKNLGKWQQTINNRRGDEGRNMNLEIILDNWFVRNISSLKTIVRIIFGVFWAIDGVLKFQPGYVDSFPASIKDAASGQPPWLAGWFSFWSSTTSSNPAFYVYSTGILEIAIAFCLIVGFMRKPAYTVSLFLSLVIWSVPEGFGGAYGPGSSYIGTGVVYAIVSLMLLMINAIFGPSRYSLDFFVERKWPRWKKIAEIKSS